MFNRFYITKYWFHIVPYLGLFPYRSPICFCWFYILNISLSGYPLGCCGCPRFFGETSLLLMLVATPPALEQTCCCVFWHRHTDAKKMI